MVAFVEEHLDTHIGKIQLWRGGSGDPLVYLHSAGGENVHPSLEQLAADYEVIVPIFPGFNESEGLDEIDGMEDAVFHLLDLWEILGLEAQHERVHCLAPGPEIVGGMTAHLREPGHRALERVRMHVRHPGKDRSGRALEILRG